MDDSDYCLGRKGGDEKERKKSDKEGREGSKVEGKGGRRRRERRGQSPPNINKRILAYYLIVTQNIMDFPEVPASNFPLWVSTAHFTLRV